MVFLQPIFLYGLFLLAIPVLIHFLNFRRSKTVFFSSLRFIEEVKSTYRKRTRITDLLLLFLRLLILACLILAFAQPVIQKEKTINNAPASITGLFIDNSLSMELSEKGESLLSQAKVKAKQVVKACPPDTRFQLLFSASMNELPGKTDRELTLSLIDAIKPSPNQMPVEDILKFFSQANDNQQVKITSVILISDFQESIFLKPLTPGSGTTTIYPISIKAAAASNISIDSCWLDNPMTLLGQNNAVVARVNNRSGQDYEDFPVRLVINDTLRNETALRLPANTVTEVSLGFHPTSMGWQTGSVELSDFPVVFDNELLFSFNIESDIRVLHLHGAVENDFVKNAFGNDPYFTYENYSEKGFPRSDFKDYNLVILSGIRNIETGTAVKIKDFMQTGGTVWFFPELDGQLSSYNAFLTSINVPQLQGIVPYRVESRIGNGQELWLQGVVVNVDKRLRLPYFNQSLRVTPVSPDRIDFLNSVSGDLLLSRFQIGNGSFILSGFALDQDLTDFMFHPLFIPICYRIATLSKTNTSLYLVNGSNQPVGVPADINGGKVIKLKNPKTGFETIPIQHLGSGKEIILFPGRLPSAGIYSAISGTDTVSKTAFNTSRIESVMNYLPDSVIRNRLKGAGWNIPMNNNSFDLDNPKQIVGDIAAKKVWYYFLIMALMALVAESFVLKAKK